MRHRRIDLNLIVALQVLLEHRSVTRAALALNVTQSTMSGILARLREGFGDPLLTPVGRHLRLTPLAESLIGPTQEAMGRIDTLLDTQPVFDPATARRRIVVATSDYVISAFLGDVLAEMAREAPGLSFVLAPPVSGWSGELDAGAFDFVICPAYISAAEHPSAVLFDDDYSVVAWRDNPRIGDSLSLAEYQSLGHVGYGANSGRAWFEQWYLTEFGDTRRVELQVASFNLLPSLVVGTERVATVQSRLARRMADALPLRLLPLPMPVPRLTEVLQWSRHRHGDPVHVWLRSHLLAAAAGHGAG